VRCYLAVLGEVVEGGDMELELLGLCELAEADAQRGQVVARNILSFFQDLLTSEGLIP